MLDGTATRKVLRSGRIQTRQRAAGNASRLHLLRFRKYLARRGFHAVAAVRLRLIERGVRTICVHGDNPEAVAFARAVREALVARGFTLKAFA